MPHGKDGLICNICVPFDRERDIFLQVFPELEWFQVELWSLERFWELKTYLDNAPLLMNPKDEESRILYLTSTPNEVSTILVWEEGGIQLPIYYVRKELVGDKK